MSLLCILMGDYLVVAGTVSNPKLQSKYGGTADLMDSDTDNGIGESNLSINLEICAHFKQMPPRKAWNHFSLTAQGE